MKRTIGLAVLASVIGFAGAAHAQGMLLDYAADRVIQKYTASTCDQLKASRDQPPNEKEKAALDFLRSDVLSETGDWRPSDIMDGSTQVEPVASLLRLLVRAQKAHWSMAS